jgi:hypothetical protein
MVNEQVYRILIALGRRKLLKWMPDKMYIQLCYKAIYGRPLDLDNPITFNEKLQWLKLYDRNPEYTILVDKYRVKEYIADTLGSKYLIPTIGVWKNANDINFDSLPNAFVLKCNHDSAGLVICKDKNTLNRNSAITKLKNCLRRNGFWFGREWPYKNVHRRVIAEQYMEDESGYELKDYKIFCFDGKPKLLFVATDRQIHKTKFDFFDLDWNHLPFTNGHPNNPKPILKPKNFEKMLEIAAKLSKGIPHVRVDLYNIDGKIYFGEMTFFHWSGIVPFVPEEWDYKIGDMLHLPTQLA